MMHLRREGDADIGVTASGFIQSIAGTDLPLPLCILYRSLPYPILNQSAGVEELALG